MTTTSPPSPAGDGPGYERLIGLLEAGEVDAVVSWAPERLHRSPRELEDFIAVVERRKVLVETAKAGTWDMSTSNSRMVARMLGAVSRAESERIGERVSRAHQQAKAQGRWRGPVPYGMGRRASPGEPEPDPHTADHVRQMAARVIRGDALTTIAADLNIAGVPPKRGKAWTHTSVSRLLASPAIGGLVESEGELIDAAFAGISISATGDPSRPTLPDALVARPDAPGETDPPWRDHAMHGARRPLYGTGDPYSRTYQAASPGTCYVRTIREPVDDFVRDVIVQRLSKPDAAAVLLKPRALQGGSGGGDRAARKEGCNRWVRGRRPTAGIDCPRAP